MPMSPEKGMMNMMRLLSRCGSGKKFWLREWFAMGEGGVHGPWWNGHGTDLTYPYTLI
jgi:hypothetical protein